MLPDDQKGELWGSWGWSWDGQNDCTAETYSASTDIVICHSDSKINVTYGGNTYARDVGRYDA